MGKGFALGSAGINLPLAPPSTLMLMAALLGGWSKIFVARVGVNAGWEVQGVEQAPPSTLMLMAALLR